MTVIDRRMFDELAHVLLVNKVGNALILQIADVCSRANRNFKRDWFLEAAGYVSLTSKVKLLKLGNKTRVVPIAAGNKPDVTPAVWPAASAGAAHTPHSQERARGWGEIPADVETFAPKHPDDAHDMSYAEGLARAHCIGAGWQYDTVGCTFRHSERNVVSLAANWIDLEQEIEQVEEDE